MSAPIQQEMCESVCDSTFCRQPTLGKYSPTKRNEKLNDGTVAEWCPTIMKMNIHAQLIKPP
jgi:hypothetical protein